MTILFTERLRLEPFQDSHLDGLCAINGDPEIMRYITGRPQTRDETAESIARVKSRWEQFGFSWWSFFELASGRIVGNGCIQYIAGNPANPIEIGWRLKKDCWHQGLASEAARSMTAFAFDTIAINELVAVAEPENWASRRVMERLGMRFRGIEQWYDRDIAAYAIARSQWQQGHKRPN
jgi:ribosomal-protein-alanine N-acetyltransferase